MHTIEEAASLLADRRRILVFTGAGISTESGIPDFRGPQGVWKEVDPADFTIERFLASEQVRIDRWRRRFEDDSPEYRPNAAHEAVARLWQSGLMVGCVTQNIDGLHQAAGLPGSAVAELHGNGKGIACYDHGHPADPAEVEARWREGDADPRCLVCGSILKTTVVFFGEMLPDAAIARADEFTAQADAAIAVGSTLGVYPAAFYPLEVASRAEPFVILNQGPTELDHVATVRLEGKAGTLLPLLVHALI